MEFYGQRETLLTRKRGWGKEFLFNVSEILFSRNVILAKLLALSGAVIT
jgi:hypothetical protein